jgi:hypothetical protein
VGTRGGGGGHNKHGKFQHLFLVLEILQLFFFEGLIIAAKIKYSDESYFML